MSSWATVAAASVTSVLLSTPQATLAAGMWGEVPGHDRPPNLGCAVRHGSRPLPSHLRQSKPKTCRCQDHSTIGTAGLHLWSKFSPHKQTHRVTYGGSVCQMYHRVTELLIGPKNAVMSLPRPRINSPGLDSDTSQGGLDYSRGWMGERMRKHPNLQLGAHSPPSLPTPQGLTTRFLK